MFQGPSYDGLFAREEDEDLDAMLADDDDGNSSAGQLNIQMV